MPLAQMSKCREMEIRSRRDKGGTVLETHANLNRRTEEDEWLN